jgi:hypothetical protein
MQYPPRDAVERFEDILKEKKTVSEIPARYGLTMALLEAKDTPRATREAELLLKAAPDSSMVAVLVANVRMAAGDRKGAFELYAEAIKRFPRWRALIYDYTRALLATKRPREALADNQQRVAVPAQRSAPLPVAGAGLCGARAETAGMPRPSGSICHHGQPVSCHQSASNGLRSGDGDYYHCPELRRACASSVRWKPRASAVHSADTPSKRLTEEAPREARPRVRCWHDPCLQRINSASTQGVKGPTTRVHNVYRRCTFPARHCGMFNRLKYWRFPP